MDSNGISDPPAAHGFIVGPEVFIKQIGRLRGVRPVFRFYPVRPVFDSEGWKNCATTRSIELLGWPCWHSTGWEFTSGEWMVELSAGAATPEDDKRELEPSY